MNSFLSDNSHHSHNLHLFFLFDDDPPPNNSSAPTIFSEVPAILGHPRFGSHSFRSADQNVTALAFTETGATAFEVAAEATINDYGEANAYKPMATYGSGPNAPYIYTAYMYVYVIPGTVGTFGWAFDQSSFLTVSSSPNYYYNAGYGIAFIYSYKVGAISNQAFLYCSAGCIYFGWDVAVASAPGSTTTGTVIVGALGRAYIYQNTRTAGVSIDRLIVACGYTSQTHTHNHTTMLSFVG